MNPTDIEWALNPDGSPGFTSNPITGCLNGCDYCYAKRLAETRLRTRYLANKNTAPRGYGEPFVEDILTMNDPFYPRFWPERLEELRGLKRRTNPRGIFVADMGDLFGIGVPEGWTNEVLDAIEINKRDRFYLLTKQPQNLPKFSPFPDNCWVGVTATNQDMFDEAICYLSFIEAAVKYISFEPLLERVQDLCWNKYSGSWLREYINWVIIGAQTKPYKPPKIEWVKEIVEAADKAGVAVFLKDNLEPLWTSENRIEPFFKFSRPSPGATSIGKLRQELPEVK